MPSSALPPPTPPWLSLSPGLMLALTQSLILVTRASISVLSASGLSLGVIVTETPFFSCFATALPPSGT